jgi:hypothetical protein
MAAVSDDLDKMPVVRKLADFDRNSGSILERLVFNNRLVMVAICAVITVALGYVAVQFTGKVVALVGITLAAGVVTWAFSPIKFQADMGILLTFMFIWNVSSVRLTFE